MYLKAGSRVHLRGKGVRSVDIRFSRRDRTTGRIAGVGPAAIRCSGQSRPCAGKSYICSPDPSPPPRRHLRRTQAGGAGHGGVCPGRRSGDASGRRRSSRRARPVLGSVVMLDRRWRQGGAAARVLATALRRHHASAAEPDVGARQAAGLHDSRLAAAAGARDRSRELAERRRGGHAAPGGAHLRARAAGRGGAPLAAASAAAARTGATAHTAGPAAAGSLGAPGRPQAPVPVALGGGPRRRWRPGPPHALDRTRRGRHGARSASSVSRWALRARPGRRRALVPRAAGPSRRSGSGRNAPIPDDSLASRRSCSR